jgi:hypothetical protein
MGGVPSINRFTLRPDGSAVRIAVRRGFRKYKFLTPSPPYAHPALRFPSPRTQLPRASSADPPPSVAHIQPNPLDSYHTPEAMAPPRPPKGGRAYPERHVKET